MKSPFIPLLAAAFSITAVSQAASYIENFTHSSTGNIGHSNAAIGWKAYDTPDATDRSDNTSNNNGGFLIATPVGMGGTVGYGAKAGQTNNYFGIAFTEEVASLNISTSDITSISFQSRNSNTDDLYRIVIALDVGGTTHWFTTDVSYASATANAAWGDNFHEFNFVTTESAWRSLTFTPGSTLSLSGTTLGSPLPDGTLVAAGLFLSGFDGGNVTANATMRYDDFTINYVPEPSATMLGALAFGLNTLGRRRKI